MSVDSRRSSSSLETVLSEVRTLTADGEALKAYDLLLSSAKAYAESCVFNYAKGSIALRLGKLDAAIESFESAIAIGPPIPEYFANLGAAMLEKARAGGGQIDCDYLDGAVKALEKAAELGPGLPVTHNNLGLALLMAGDSSKALQEFESAIDINPRYVEALYNKAGTLKQIGMTSEAVETLDLLLSIDPTYEPAVYIRQRLDSEPS